MRLPNCLLAALCALASASNGCSAPRSVPPAASPPRPLPTPAAAVADPASCGPLGCRLFDSPQQALQHVLASRPLVLGIGEAHAQKGTEGIASATKRFTEQLLPLFQHRASDLVVELWTANPSCPRKQVEQVEQRQQQVTERQASSNQGEFLALGHAAKALGVRPHALEPSCEEYDRILGAGKEDISEMLAMIARATEELVKRILHRNQAQSVDKIVIAYGGALHNDLTPRDGRESWSFGAALAAYTGGRYVELDLIVPEYIQDDEPWRSLEWTRHFDKDRHPGKTVLFHPSPASYVLIFPASAPASPAPQPSNPSGKPPPPSAP